MVCTLLYVQYILVHLVIYRHFSNLVRWKFSVIIDGLFVISIVIVVLYSSSSSSSSNSSCGGGGSSSCYFYYL
jgi:heme/copper-type cytochrome/quinol oxidase subunit 4